MRSISLQRKGQGNGKVTKNEKSYGGVYSLSIEKDGISYMYIGSSQNIVRRLEENNSKLKRGVHHCGKLQELYNQGYRLNVELLEVVQDIKQQINTEAEYIEHFKRIEGIEVLNIMDPVISAPRVYLSTAKVVQIKKLLNKNLEPKEVARITGVRLPQIYRIKSGDRWSNVKVI